MNKKIIKKSSTIGIYLLIFMCLLSLPFSTTRAMTKEEGIKVAFEETDAQVEEINMTGHVRIDNLFVTADEGKKMVLDLGEKFGLKNPVVEDFSTEEDNQFNLTGKNKEGDAVFISVQAYQDETITETNIFIDWMMDNKMVDTDLLGEQIKDTLKGYGKVEITACITGTYPGKLTSSEKEIVLQKIMKTLDAKEIEGIREERMTSIVGYSKRIKDYISYGGNKVNLNTALRYNSYEDKTYLWLATPLIMIGY